MADSAPVSPPDGHQPGRFRLTREVRFAASDVEPAGVRGSNGYAGVPPVTRLGQPYYRLAVTLQGEPDASSGYLVNIKRVDAAVRESAVPVVTRDAVSSKPTGGGGTLLRAFDALTDALPDWSLDAVTLHFSPFAGLTARRDLVSGDPPMLVLHHTFEFAASHRLHNPSLSDDQNRAVFGKCNNPHGHGHNYQVRVSVRGPIDDNGFVVNFYDLESLVSREVIEPFDHKHLNLELPEFRALNPSVENIAAVIHRKLADAVKALGVTLDAVTVWETEKTWCEYRTPA